MRTELILKFQFRASHSLENYEAPHFHVWKLEASVEGRPRNGKLVDMVQLREDFDRVIQPLEAIHLNDEASLGQEARRFPTCETLAAHFLSVFRSSLQKSFAAENPSLRLAAVAVSLCEDDGRERATARVWAD